MVDLVVAPIRKISEKQRRNVSRNSRYKRLGMTRRERGLARKKNHAHSSGSPLIKSKYQRRIRNA